MKITEKQRDKIIDGLRTAIKLFGRGGCRWTKGDWVMREDGGDDIPESCDFRGVHRFVEKFGVSTCKFCLDGALMIAASTKKEYAILFTIVERYGPTISQMSLHSNPAIAFNDSGAKTFMDIRNELMGTIRAFRKVKLPIDIQTRVSR